MYLRIKAQPYGESDGNNNSKDKGSPEDQKVAASHSQNLVSLINTWLAYSQNCQNAYISLRKRLFCPDCRSCGFWDQWHMIRVNKNGWPHLVQQSDTIILPHLCHRGKVQWHIFLGNSAKPLAVAFQNIYLPTVPWAHHHLLIGTIVKILNIFLFSREVLGDTVDLTPK